MRNQSVCNRSSASPLVFSSARKIAKDRGSASGSVQRRLGHPLADNPRIEIRDRHLFDVHPQPNLLLLHYFVGSGEKVTGMLSIVLPNGRRRWGRNFGAALYERTNVKPGMNIHTILVSSVISLSITGMCVAREIVPPYAAVRPGYAKYQQSTTHSTGSRTRRLTTLPVACLAIALVRTFVFGAGLH